MVIITVTGISCSIKGLYTLDEQRLVSKFTLQMPGSFYIRKNLPKHKQSYYTGDFSFVTPKLFLRGLLPEVESCLQSMNVRYEVRGLEPTQPFTRAPLLKGELLPHQVPVVEKMLPSRDGIIHAATNAGKSYILAGFLQSYRQKTLILIHRTELKMQLLEDLKELTNLKIGVISAGDQFKDGDVIVATVRSLSNRITKGGREIKNLLAQIKCLCVDECHHITAFEHQRCILACPNLDRIYGFSGTPFKDASIYNKYEVTQYFGPVIARVTNQELSDSNVSAKADIFFVVYNTPSLPKNLSYQETYIKGVEDCDSRNEKIISIIKSFPDKKGLIICNTIMHGEELEFLCEQAGVANFAFINGASESKYRETARQDFIKGKLKVLIATTIFDEGVNLKDMNYLILAAGGKSAVRTLQRLGRGIRKKTDGSSLALFDFVDNHHRYLKKHYIQRLETYKDEGCFTINTIRLS